jgi:hypothetical protein
MRTPVAFNFRGGWLLGAPFFSIISRIPAGEWIATADIGPESEWLSL